MHLTVVHGWPAELRRLDRVAVDAPRRAPGASLHEHGTARLPLKPDDAAGQLERLSHWYLLRCAHRCLRSLPVPYLLFPAASGWFPVGQLLRIESVTNHDHRNGKQLSMEVSDGAVIADSLERPATFGVIFDRHGSTLLRFLARRVDPSGAEDLLGEVFRIAFERRSTFQRDRDSARPWLYGIAANVVAKHHRSEARRLRAIARVSAIRALDEDPAERAVAAADADVRWTRVIEAIG